MFENFKKHSAMQFKMVETECYRRFSIISAFLILTCVHSFIQVEDAFADKNSVHHGDTCVNYTRTESFEMDTVATRNIATEVLKLCPETQFDDFPTESAVRYCETCCFYCNSQDKSCIDKRTCCPEQHANIKDEDDDDDEEEADVKYSCQTGLLYHTKGPSENDLAFDRYKFIATCSPDSDAHAHAQCIMNHEDVQDLIDVIPLTDLDTMKNYANKYCAICDGVPVTNTSRIRFWTPYFE